MRFINNLRRKKIKEDKDNKLINKRHGAEYILDADEILMAKKKWILSCQHPVKREKKFKQLEINLMDFCDVRDV